MTDIQSDKELVRKVLENRGAFKEIIDRYQRLVCHVVFRMVLNETDREELCQQVFVKIYKNLDSFAFRSKLSTWIARIAYTTCISHLEKRRVPLLEDLPAGGKKSSTAGRQTPAGAFERVLSEDEPADDRMIREETLRHLYAEIEDLPVKYRAILTLYHLDELSYREIGEVMDLPDGTVKNLLFRARKQLKERLSNRFSREGIESLDH